MKQRGTAPKKQNPKRSFIRLRKSIISGSSDDMLSALSEMNSFNQALMGEFKDWKYEAAREILFQKNEEDRLCKLKLFLENTSRIEDPHNYLISVAVGVRSAGGVKMLLDAGYQANLGKNELDDLVRSVCYGFWIHLDRLYPDYFKDNQRYVEFRKELGERMFDPVAYQYADGLGFFRVEFLEHIVKMKHPEYIASAIYGAMSKARLYPSSSAHNPDDPAPWSEGIGYLVHQGFLSWKEIESSVNHRSDMGVILSAARRDYEKMQLEQQTPAAHMKSRPGVRL